MENSSISKECFRLEESLEHTMIAHWQIATVWRFTHWALGLPATVFGTLATASAAKTFLPEYTVIFASLAAVFSALVTFVNAQKLARDSHSAGVRSQALQARIRRFREIDLTDPKMDLKIARKTLEKLAEEKAHLQETTPHTGGLARWLGVRSTRLGHARHAVDQHE